MHNLFKEKRPNAPVLYSYYVKYFKEHYNLRIGRPQIDTCCKCEELNIKIKSASLGDAAKRAAIVELLVHKRRSKKFYTSLKESVDECKNRDDLMALSFDFMQNVHLPEVPVQDLFYLTQLNVNIFGIHNLKTGKAIYYIYHEGIAKKGPNEVCSFLLDYVDNYVPKSVQQLRLYSDNCPGQNKHHPIIRMCMALTETGRFATVEQFYPVRGHSFLPNDRDFGLIKKKLRRHDRVFSVHQYTEMIASASASHKFTVKEVITADILNFKDWWSRYYKKNSISLETNKRGTPRDKKQSFSISQFHYFLHQSSKPGYVVASEFINSFAHHTFQLNTPINSDRSQVVMPQAKAYPSVKVPILETKIEHMKLMLRYIEEEYLNFYEDIINNWPTTRRDNSRKE